MTFLKGHQKVQAKVCYFLFIQIIENMWREIIVIGFDIRKIYSDVVGLGPLLTPTFAKAEGT